MQLRHLVVPLTVAGVLASAVPGSRVSGAQRPTLIEGNASCVQDFPSAASPDPRATVVMCGLDNPRGLMFNQSALTVAEAGRGGFGLGTADCFVGAVGATRCVGPTGAISQLWNGAQTRVATGFPSHATTLGRQAIGPNDVALVPAPGDAATASECAAGCAYVAIGLQQPPGYRDLYPFLADFAKLAQFTPGGGWRYVADLGAYETAHNPDQVYKSPPQLDTNPYGLLVDPAGRQIIVADAGANALLRVSAAGYVAGNGFVIDTEAVLRPHPTAGDDAVPTSVAIGPDGARYIGELTGFPLIRGEANVLRLGRAGDEPAVCLSGFTQIMDLAFDKNGDLYVLEFQGRLMRITPATDSGAAGDGEGAICARYAAGVRTAIVTGLTNPTSVALGPDGALYISNRGVLPATGQVLRIER